MRENYIKTLLSLSLLNLFLFIQLLAATSQVDATYRSGNEPELRCTVSHWSTYLCAEIVSVDILIPEPAYIEVSEQNAVLFHILCRYFVTPGRGPPAFHA